MKWFLILVMVGAAAAAVGDYYEPADVLNETVVQEMIVKGKQMVTCSGFGDPTFISYDGSVFLITDPGKILITQWDDPNNPGDVCKFKVTCVIMDTYFMEPGITSPLWIDWCAVAFHPHKVPKKYFRNWVFGQSLTYILERGMGYAGAIKVSTDSSTHRLFPLDGCTGTDRSSWHPDVPDPACCPASDVTYRIWIDTVKEVIRFRDHCCGWAIDFYPRGRDTYIIINLDPDHPDHPDFPRTGMRGICGDNNGDYENDWKRCDNDGIVTVNGAGSWDTITRSCQEEFKHSGLSYVGGTKIPMI